MTCDVAILRLVGGFQEGTVTRILDPPSEEKGGSSLPITILKVGRPLKLVTTNSVLHCFYFSLEVSLV